MDVDANAATNGGPRERGDEPLVYRKPTPRGKREALNFKVTASLKASLLLVKRLWRLRAEVEGASKSEVEAIDLTYVCAALLESGIDSAWDEVGQQVGLHGAPKSDADWAALRAAFEAKRAAQK